MVKFFFALLILLLAQPSLQQQWKVDRYMEVFDISAARSVQGHIIMPLTTPQGLKLSTGGIVPSVRSPTAQGHLAIFTANGTWVLALFLDQSIVVMRSTSQDIKSWPTVLQAPALDREIVMAANQDGVWMICWTDVNGTLIRAQSNDDGFTWTVQSMPSFTNVEMTSLAAWGPADFLLALTINGTEMLLRLSDEQILHHGSSGRPYVAVDNQTLLLLTGSGDLFSSHDGGVNWSEPIRLEPGAIRVNGHGDWEVFSYNLSYYRSTNNWTREQVGSGSMEKVVWYNVGRLYYIHNGTAFLAYRRVVYSPPPIIETPSELPVEAPPAVEVVSENTTLVVSDPLVINASLMVSGTVVVESSLLVNGDLVLTKTSTLDLSNQTEPIEITGSFTAAGRLILPAGGGVLIKYNSSEGDFDEVETPECTRVERTRSQLEVASEFGCEASELQLWMIITIVVVVVVIVVVAVVLAVCFRRVVFPHRDRQHYIPSSKLPPV